MEPRFIADGRLPAEKADLSQESQSEVPPDSTEDVREKEIPTVTYGHIAGFDARPFASCSASSHSLTVAALH